MTRIKGCIAFKLAIFWRGLDDATRPSQTSPSLNRCGLVSIAPAVSSQQQRAEKQYHYLGDINVGRFDPREEKVTLAFLEMTRRKRAIGIWGRNRGRVELRMDGWNCRRTATLLCRFCLGFLKRREISQCHHDSSYSGQFQTPFRPELFPLLSLSLTFSFLLERVSRVLVLVRERAPLRPRN